MEYQQHSALQEQHAQHLQAKIDHVLAAAQQQAQAADAQQLAAVADHAQAAAAEIEARQDLADLQEQLAAACKDTTDVAAQLDKLRRGLVHLTGARLGDGYKYLSHVKQQNSCDHQKRVRAMEAAIAAKGTIAKMSAQVAVLEKCYGEDWVEETTKMVAEMRAAAEDAVNCGAERDILQGQLASQEVQADTEKDALHQKS